MATGDEILAALKAEQIPFERNDCPVCGWTIEKHPETGTLHCILCGWTYGVKK